MGGSKETRPAPPRTSAANKRPAIIGGLQGLVHAQSIPTPPRSGCAASLRFRNTALLRTLCAPGHTIPETPGKLLPLHCRNDDDGLLLMRVPPDRVLMAAIYETAIDGRGADNQWLLR